MRRFFTLVCILIFVFTGCSGKSDDLAIDYGDSTLYTTEEIDRAISVVQEEFSAFDGCKLQSLSYAGDEKSEMELAYYNSAEQGKEYVSCIVLHSTFRSPENGGGAWTADTEYAWDWILVKESAGDWVLLTYGN